MDCNRLLCYSYMYMMCRIDVRLDLVVKMFPPSTSSQSNLVCAWSRTSGSVFLRGNGSTHTRRCTPKLLCAISEENRGICFKVARPLWNKTLSASALSVTAGAQHGLIKPRCPHVQVVLPLLWYCCWFACCHLVGSWEMLLHVDSLTEKL